MSGSLITLPWRVGARGAGLAIRTAGGIVQLAGDVTGLVGAKHRSARDEDLDGAPSTVPDPPEAPAATSPAAIPQADTLPQRSAPAHPPAAAEPAASPEPPGVPDLPEEFEPTHVSDERELVEEVAEPGAEDGAGAQVTIAEPWDGYRLMNAGAVIDRLPGLTAAELAAVELYELSNRGRQTLLTAVRRELKQRS